jgi:hypothetical protein
MKKSIAKEVDKIKVLMTADPDYTTEQLYNEVCGLYWKIVRMTGSNFSRAFKLTDKIHDDLIEFRWRLSD